MPRQSQANHRAASSGIVANHRPLRIAGTEGIPRPQTSPHLLDGTGE
uniref:Alternative protein ZNF688 n=1 Tax=Homo sapiens TaxID=9606 RepID=L0R5I2_HUMAN|nr:alternative protein ZNF688 [Homo sapiens]